MFKSFKKKKARKHLVHESKAMTMNQEQVKIGNNLTEILKVKNILSILKKILKVKKTQQRVNK